MKNTFMLVLCLCLPAAASAQDIKIGGTIRGKYEWQPQDGENRFEVRNTRVNVSGNLNPQISYKAEVDLCDEGQIKMLDAYTRIHPWKTLTLTIGQLRVPFTIDAHRAPHQQFFANRSFLAKYVGNVRDVGFCAGYTFDLGMPLVVEAGLFNGSGLTSQKDYWTRQVNFSAKAQLKLPFGLNVVLSAQKIKPSDAIIMMYDCGLSYTHGGLLAEVEYLYKHYQHDAFHPVHSFNSILSYDIPLRHCFFHEITPLVRYDYMQDHSDGKHYLDGVLNDAGTLIVNDYLRSRITAGATLSIDKPFISDIRINFEKYFYRSGAVAKVSEQDKIVIEVMTHF